MNSYYALDNSLHCIWRSGKPVVFFFYGWRRGYQPETCDPRIVFDSLAAADVPWTGYLYDQLDPFLIDAFGGNHHRAIRKIKQMCPLFFKKMFAQCLRELVWHLKLEHLHDVIFTARQFALSMREYLTPMLYYAWLFGAKTAAYWALGLVRYE